MMSCPISARMMVVLIALMSWPCWADSLEIVDEIQFYESLTDQVVTVSGEFRAAFNQCRNPASQL